jgi:membrane-associated protease RseP (regulator of RpoE activity)
MPNKKALFDVGISGPIAGFLVAIPVTIYGLTQSTPHIIADPTSESVILGPSLLFLILVDLFIEVPAGATIDLSITAFAGWIGLLITSINLLPAGQLDGGHIFRAALGKYQKYAGWIAIVIMVFTGLIFFALLIVFVMGMVHPPPLNDDTKLDLKRRLLFIVAIIILILCYIPNPITTIPIT